MYLGGTTDEHKNQHWKPMGPIICRYDRWSKSDRKLRWHIVAPYAQGSKGHESCEPMGFDVAGDYLFVPYTGASKELGFSTGHIEVFKAGDGRSAGPPGTGCMDQRLACGRTGRQGIHARPEVQGLRGERQPDVGRGCRQHPDRLRRAQGSKAVMQNAEFRIKRDPESASPPPVRPPRGCSRRTDR